MGSQGLCDIFCRAAHIALNAIGVVAVVSAMQSPQSLPELALGFAIAGMAHGSSYGIWRYAHRKAASYKSLSAGRVEQADLSGEILTGRESNNVVRLQLPAHSASAASAEFPADIKIFPLTRCRRPHESREAYKLRVEGLQLEAQDRKIGEAMASYGSGSLSP
ncbi:MAG: hypothetical protein LRY36_01685 [Alphaproteobacteria bacterium]|nr:hypothetical protein [Alphaproteobacteria bacterium]MCD8566628.1 hypothetical protein [Alphaproteobacteria bacterium]